MVKDQGFGLAMAFLMIATLTILGLCAYRSMHRQITNLQIIVCELYLDKLSEETFAMPSSDLPTFPNDGYMVVYQ